jgi:hypothetical protein
VLANKLLRRRKKFKKVQKKKKKKKVHNYRETKKKSERRVERVRITDRAQDGSGPHLQTLRRLCLRKARLSVRDIGIVCNKNSKKKLNQIKISTTFRHKN